MSRPRQKTKSEIKITRRKALQTLVLAAGGLSLTKSNLGLANELEVELGGGHRGFESAANYPLFKAVYNRRSRRISKGLGKIPAGSATYSPKNDEKPHPLSAEEEAVLIAMTGLTGLVMPDRPFQDQGNPPNNILGTPNIRMTGRSAGSADNAQNTHFFLINDVGTFYLDPKKLDPIEADTKVTMDVLVKRANRTKVRIQDRLAFPREFPFYFDSNRFLSNVPGSTMLLPVVDFSIQYINGLMYLLTQPDAKHRPLFIDDKTGKPAFLPEDMGFVRDFVNPELALPLSLLGTFRAHIESDLLMQNLMLTLQAMGLGGWIHACYEGPILLGHPAFQQMLLKARFLKQPNLGLNFKYGVPFDNYHAAHPVGKEGVIETYTPEWHGTMDNAVDALLKNKYGAGGAYSDVDRLKKIFKDGTTAETYSREVPKYSDETVACVKAVCNYIYKTYGRFPATVDAIHVPGIWLQAHHLDLEYYRELFQSGFIPDIHRDHEKNWHS